MLEMLDLFKLMHEKGASDLHLAAGAPPVIRVDGDMVPTSYEKLSGEAVQSLVFSLMNDAQRQRFDATSELDMAFGVKATGQRLRMNVFRQRGSVGCVKIGRAH